MASPRAIARLRRALLALLVALVAAVVGLYFFGRAGLERPSRAATATDETVPQGDVTMVGKGFEYSFEEGGRTVFSIRGESYRMDRAENVYIDGMAVTAYAADGDPYHLEGARALYNQKTEETVLSGDVRVVGPLGIEMTTGKLELADRGRNILSQQPVAFRYGETATGSAERMRVDLEERLFILAGRVHLESLPGAEAPFALSANRMFFDRTRHHARADGRVAVAFGPHWLKARRMSLWLTDDDRGLQFARALSEVRGRLRIGDGEASGAGEGGAARFEGRTATAVFEPQSRELRRFELEGRPTRPATLWSVSPDEPPRILTAGYITGDLAGGLLSRVSALGGVRLAEVSEAPPEEPWEDPAEAGAEVLVESSGESDEAAEGEGEGEGEGEAGDSLEGAALDAAPAANRDGLVVSTELPAELPPGTLRIVTGVRGEAVFGAEGRLTELSLLDGFALLAPEIRGRGERARLDLASGVGEFLGEPVEVSTADGDLAAPRLLYTQRSGLLYAEGGARTRLAEAASAGALAGSPLGQGEGPVWVESQEAFLRDRPRSFLFRGKVRAWRGEALLLADELQGNGDEGRLAASGHVRSLWPGERAEGDESAPVEVTAGTLAYARGEGRLVYRQDVVAVQGSRSLAAQELTVELGEGGRAEVLIARGAVRIEDRTSGKTVQGDRARYVVSGSEVEVEGEKVVMRDKAGAEVSGRRVVYRFDTGVVEVQGAAGPAGPAGER